MNLILFTIKFKKIMKIQTAYNYERPKGQVFTQPSLTVPDQSMSIREILHRFARGLSPSSSRTPMFEGNDQTEFDEYMPDLRGLDLSEREEVLAAAKAEVDEIKSRYQKQQTQELKAKENTAIDKRVQERMAKYMELEKSKSQFRNDDKGSTPHASPP